MTGWNRLHEQQYWAQRTRLPSSAWQTCGTLKWCANWYYYFSGDSGCCILWQTLLILQLKLSFSYWFPSVQGIRNHNCLLWPGRENLEVVGFYSLSIYTKLTVYFYHLPTWFWIVASDVEFILLGAFCYLIFTSSSSTLIFGFTRLPW